VAAAAAAAAAVAATEQARVPELGDELRALEDAAAAWPPVELERSVPGVAALADRIARVEYELLFDIGPARVTRVVLGIDIDAPLDSIELALRKAGWAIARSESGYRELTRATEKLLLIAEEHGPQLTVMHDGEWSREAAAEWVATTPFAPLVELCDELSSIAFARTRDARVLGRLCGAVGPDLDRPDRLLARLGAVRHDEDIVRAGMLFVEDRGGTIDAYLGGIPELAGALPR
jgi:hypothetical protein